MCVLGMRVTRRPRVALTFATPGFAQSQTSEAQGVAATDGPGGAASWTTGNKLAVGTSAGDESKVWFTVAKGITSETFYPRLDVPNMQDMQYVITDGSTFVDLERDATSHAISMPSEKALEYTVTNTDTRPSPKYRITNTYIADPRRIAPNPNTFRVLDKASTACISSQTPVWLAVEQTTKPGGRERTRRSWQAAREPCLVHP